MPSLVEQVREIRDRFVASDAKKIGGAADAERSQLGQRDARRNSTPSSGSAAATLVLNAHDVSAYLPIPSRHHQFVAGAADVARADGQDRVAGPSFAQQEFDGRLHGAEVVTFLWPASRMALASASLVIPEWGLRWRRKYPAAPECRLD